MHPDIKKHLSDPLYKNSFFIFLNALTTALLGFFFWMLVARLYSSEDVGLATALISTATIIASLSGFGLSTGVIRFLPRSNEQNILFNSVLLISIASALVFGFIFIVGINIFSPALGLFIKPLSALIFLLFLIFQVSAGIVNVVLLAFRKAEYSFAQNLGLGLRILLLVPLASAGVLGIFGGLSIAFMVSFVMGLLMLHRVGISVWLIFRKKVIKDIIHFSLANYVADFLVIAESSILPILILNVIGAKETAYFYVAFSIASLLYAVSNSVFMSMFIECSHGEPLWANMVKSLTTVGAIMIPAGVVIYSFGDVLLTFYSKEYSHNAYEILKLLVLSAVFVTFNTMFIAVKRIQNDLKPLIVVNVLLFVFTVLFSYLFMLQYGIIGVGMGWMMGQGMIAVVVGIIVWRNRGNHKLKDVLYKL